METLFSSYRKDLAHSEEKCERMITGVAAFIENFDAALKSSEIENKVASREMQSALKEVALLVLSRHEKDLSENAQLFSAAISSL